MYLVDTNVWFERLLDGERSDEVDRFLRQSPSDAYSMSDMSWLGISSVMSRLKKDDAFSRFTVDLFVDGEVNIVHLEPEDIKQVFSEMKQTQLDFTEAYQYITAKKYNMIFISYNEAYDRYRHGVKTPSQVVG